MSTNHHVPLVNVLRAFLRKEAAIDRRGRLVTDGVRLTADGIEIARWGLDALEIASSDCLWAARQARRLQRMHEKGVNDQDSLYTMLGEHHHIPLGDVFRWFLRKESAMDRRDRLVTDGVRLTADGYEIAIWRSGTLEIASSAFLWASRQARALAQLAEKEYSGAWYQCSLEEKA